MLSQTMLRIKRNIGTCLSEIDEIIEHCQGLLENNNIIILINGELYHKLEGECAKLTKVRHALFYIYSNLETEFTSYVLDLTLEGHELIKKINDIIECIEEKWNEGDERDIRVCHYSAWKTKQEALLFAMQMNGCGKDYVINRFELKIV